VNSTGSVKPAPIQYRDFYDTSLAPATAKKSSRTSMGPPASAAVSRPPDNRPASLAGTGVASQRLLQASVAAPAAAPRTKSPEPAALSGPVWYGPLRRYFWLDSLIPRPMLPRASCRV